MPDRILVVDDEESMCQFMKIMLSREGYDVQAEPSSQKALAKIKELWEGGQRNQANIAKAIGYPKATTNENIKRMLKAGTLSPQDQ